MLTTNELKQIQLECSMSVSEINDQGHNVNFVGMFVETDDDGRVLRVGNCTEIITLDAIGVVATVLRALFKKNYITLQQLDEAFGYIIASDEELTSHEDESTV